MFALLLLSGVDWQTYPQYFDTYAEAKRHAPPIRAHRVIRFNPPARGERCNFCPICSSPRIEPVDRSVDPTQLLCRRCGAEFALTSE